MSKFNSKIEVTRNLAKDLTPYNFPIGSVEWENYLSPLKKGEVETDGYQILYHFNRAYYGNHYLETFQIFNKHAPFLPFCLVSKLAQITLGSHHLSLVEFYQESRKVYCWTVCLDERGRPVETLMKEKSDSRIFEGFQYAYLSPDQLHFY